MARLHPAAPPGSMERARRSMNVQSSPGDDERMHVEQPHPAAEGPAQEGVNTLSEARRPIRQARGARVVVVPLLVLLLLWVWLFYSEGAFKGGPGGKAFGADYAMFVSASQVLTGGGDPYDPNVLYQTERSLMYHDHVNMIKDSERAQVRVGNPPLLYWAMQPLIDAPFVPWALISLLVLYVLSAAGFIASLRYFGWRRIVLPTLVFLLMPQVMLGVFYGNVIGIVFAAIGLSLSLSRRHSLLAGAILSLAWLKPPVALPIVMLMVLFHVSQRMRFIAGFVAASGLLLAATVLTTGIHSLALWVHGLLRYSSDMAIQPDVISLTGLYVHWAPGTLRLGLEGAALVGALALTVHYWRQCRYGECTFLDVAPLWFVWILATPYAHFYDEIILAAPMLAYLGANGDRISLRLPAVSMYLLFFSLFVLTWAPMHVYLLPLPLLAIAACLMRARRDPRFEPK